jgi:hypothetical protein
MQYIKLGQHIAQLEYLLPAEYVHAMAPMLHEAPRSPLDKVRVCECVTVCATLPPVPTGAPDATLFGQAPCCHSMGMRGGGGQP